MFEFSCKKISKKDLIKCAFGLNKTSYDLLVFLKKNKKALTVCQISELMCLHRTTVQKAITHLFEKGLVKKVQHNISEGGYLFYYLLEDKVVIKAILKDVIDLWCNGVRKAIGDEMF